MKKLASLLAVSCIALTVSAQKPNVVVKASMPGISPEEWVYYSSMNAGIKDSVKPTKDGFVIALDIPQGEGDFFIINIGKLSSASSQNKGLFIYLEKGTLQIKSNDATFKNAVFSGSKDAAYYKAFQKRDTVFGLRTTSTAFFAAQRKGDTALSTQLRTEWSKLNSQQIELDKKWLLKNASTPAIAYPLFMSLNGSLSYDALDSLLQKTTSAARNNLVVKKIEHSIKTDKLTGVGRPALDFTQNDTTGKPVSLKDFRGKYVLVDFWASWCVPCRIENPNVVSAYQQYKNKGFTVLGVPFDRPDAFAKWTKAIHDDRLYWHHVSDLKFWSNEVGKLYDIRSIPSNVLVDPNGIIVAKNLRGEALDKKLESLLGHPQMDKNVFVLKGTLDGAKENSWIHINYRSSDGKQVRDSAKLFNGVFSYIGNTSGVSSAYAYLKKAGDQQMQLTSENYFQFFIEPAVITVTGKADQLNNVKITGSAAQMEMDAFNALLKDAREKMMPISKRYDAANKIYMQMKKEGKSEEELEKMKEYANNVKDSMQPFSQQMSEITIAYLKQHPNSPVTLNQLRFYVSRMKIDELLVIYDQMKPEIRNSPEGVEIAKEIEKLKSGSPGSMATNFSGNDINGIPLKLTDFKGKYVLLDFWASWCVPCRKGNPHLLQLYSKYKKKGFEIIGVSDDDSNLPAWKKAVEKDGIGVWKHVLRGLKRTAEGGFDRSEDKSESYGIHSLPTKILIDPTGKIIGRYGGGGEDDEALDKKLAEIFDLKS